MGEDNPRRGRRVAEAVERGVEGLYDFLLRLMNTFWIVSWRRQACRALIEDRHSERAHYVLPFTYAAVGIFLVSLVAGVAGTRILDWIWFYEEISQSVVERLREGVSLVAIAAGSIPAFIFMLALSAALARTLEREFGRSGRALFVTCYAIGTQSIYLFGAAVIVSLAQVAPGGVGNTGLIEGQVGAALAAVLALLLIVCLMAAFVVPVRFFLRSFNKKRKRLLPRLAKLAAYVLISAASIWALPLIAGLPTLLAAKLNPPEQSGLTIESDPVLYMDGDRPALAVDVLIENRGKLQFGAASTEAKATIRYGKEPLENDGAETLGLDAARVENEAGQPVRYTAAGEQKLIWRRIVFDLTGEGETLLASLPDRTIASCIQVRFGSGDREIESVCVRRTVVDERPADAPGEPSAPAP